MTTKTALKPMESFQARILSALQGKPMYLGSVSAKDKARRRAANKAARKARRAGR